MLEGLVAWVLNNYLGKYVENLNTDQLSIAILSGEVELENLPLKKDALRHLGIPVEVKAGFIGKVRLQVPVRQLRSAPWVIHAERLYLVAGPIALDDWDHGAEQTATHDRKLSALDAIEACWRLETETKSTTYYSTSYSSWLSYGTGVITDIVENLQLKVHDVHLRYEDDYSVPGKAVVCGLRVEGLSAQSCDANWTPVFTHWDSSELSFKSIDLTNLSIYWDELQPDQLLSRLGIAELAAAMGREQGPDHHYIVAPVSAFAHVKRNRSEQPLRSTGTPRLVCDLQLDQAPISLSDWQYEQMVACVRGLQDIGRIQEYRRHRPVQPVKEEPRVWWLYAVHCHFPGRRWALLGSARCTWDSCLQWAKQNVQYVEVYSRVLVAPSGTLSAENKQIKDTVEWSRDFEELRALREVAMRRVPAATMSPTQNESSRGQSVLMQWFPQWWGWYSSTAPEESMDRTQSSQLEGEILEALEESVRDNTLLKRDAVFGKFSFALRGGSLSLCTGPTKDTSDEKVVMLELQFENLRLNVESRPRSSSHSVELSLGALVLRDRLTLNTLFPILVGPPGQDRNTATAARGRSKLPSPRTSRNTIDSEPLFYLMYERNPLHCSADYKLTIRSQSLDVVYQPCAARWLVDFFCRPQQRAIARSRIESIKSRTKRQLMRNWEHMLDSRAAWQRASWQLHLDISAPQIILVECFTEQGSAIAVVDFGRFRMNNLPNDSELGIVMDKVEDDDELFMTPCSTPPGSEASDTISNGPIPVVRSSDCLNEHALHHHLYDRYNIELNDMQVLVGRVRDNWRYAHTKGSSTLHVLDRFNIILQVERRVVHTSDPLYPSLTVLANLPRLVVHVNEQKVSALRTLARVFSETELPSPFNTPEAAPAAQSHIEEPSISEDTSLDASRLVMLQFTVDHLALEVQSRGRSVAELQVSGVTASFAKRPDDISVSLTVHGLLLVDALQTFGPDFELLAASHRHVGMDSMSGSLRDSEPTSPTSPGSPDPTLSRIRATSPVALTQALSNLQNGMLPWSSAVPDSEALISVEFVLVTGAEPVQFVSVQFNNLDIIANQETIVELVGFVRRVFPPGKHKHQSSPSPKMPDRNLGLSASVDTLDENSRSESCPTRTVARTELTFDFHRLSVLLLRGVLLNDGTLIGRKIATATASEARIQATVDSTLTVTGSLGGLQVLDLTPEGHLHQRIVSIGRDAVLEFSRILDPLSSLDVEKKAFGFTLKRNLNNEEERADDVLEVTVRMASVWYTHSAQFLTELQSCVVECKQYLRNLARSIRTAATDMALGLVHARTEALAQSLYMNSRISASLYGGSLTDITSPRRRRRSSGSEFAESACASGYSSTRGTTPHSPVVDCDSVIDVRLDVVLDSPVVVVPRGPTCPQVFVAHLGQISINNFTPEESGPTPSEGTEHYSLEVRDMNICSLDTATRRTPGPAVPRAEALYCCDELAQPILHDTVLRVSVVRETGRISISEPELLLETESETGEVHNGVGDVGHVEHLEITGAVVEALRVSLTRNQYEQLLDTLQWLVGHGATPVAAPLESRPSVSVRLPDIAEEDTGVSTLSMDPHVRAKLFPAPSIPKTVPSNGIISVRGSFEVSVCTVELVGQAQHPDPAPIELSFRQFVFNYEKSQRFETSVQVSLRSLLVQDLSQPEDSKRRVMVASTVLEVPVGTSVVSHSCPDLLDHFPIHSESGGSLPDHLEPARILGNYRRTVRSTKRIPEECPETPPPSPGRRNSSEHRHKSKDNLVLISSLIVDPSAHNFYTTYDSIYRTTSVDFNSLDLVVNASSWTTLLDFFSVSPSNTRPPAPTYDKDTGKEELPAEQHSTELNVTVRSLTMVLVRSDRDVAKANVSNVKFCVSQSALQNSVLGSLGSMSVVDLTLQGQLYRERFTTLGQEALRFHHIAYKQQPTDSSRDWDRQLTLDMATVLYVHTKRFVVEIQAYLNDFARPQVSPQKVEVTPENTERNEPSRMSLKINASAPLLLLPVNSYSGELLVANLGRLVVNNEFKYAEDTPCLLNVMHAELQHMDVYTGTWESSSKVTSLSTEDIDLGEFVVKRNGASLLTEKCHLTLHIKNNMHSHLCHEVPDLSISGNLTTLDGTLDLAKYRLIRGFLVHNLGENTEHILPSVRTPPVPSQTSTDTWTLTSVRLDLHNVIVRLRTTQEATTSLACIHFIKSRLTIDTFSNLSQDVDLVSQEILLLDARFEEKSSSESPNVFTHVLQSVKGPQDDPSLVQVEVHSRRRLDHSKFTILLNNIRLMAIFDWWDAVRKFVFTEVPEVKATGVLVPQRPPSPQGDSDFHPPTPYELKLNITNSEVVVVEDASVPDTNAIILKSTTVLSWRPSVDTAKPLILNLNRCEVFSCMMGMETDTALSIVDPVTVNLELHSERHTLEAQFHRLTVRLSYHDVRMLGQMAKALQKQGLWNEAPPDNVKDALVAYNISKLMGLGFEARDCETALVACDGELESAALWLTMNRNPQKTPSPSAMDQLALKADCLTVCVIDDCGDADVPLLEVAMGNVSLTQHLQDQRQGDISCVLSCDYYNRVLSGWEPFIEPWSCSAHWRQEITGDGFSPRMTLDVNSDNILDVNVTTTFVELFGQVRDSWLKDMGEETLATPAFRRRSPFVPFALRNHTGCTLSFTTVISSLEEAAVPDGESSLKPDDDWYTALPGQTVPFSFEERGKQRHRDSHKLRMHQLAVQVDGWKPIGPVSVDKVGVYFRHASPDPSFSSWHLGGPHVQIVFEINLEGSARKLVTVRSAVVLTNQLPMSIEVKLERSSFNAVSAVAKNSVVPAGESFSVPLVYVYSQLYVRPCTDQNLFTFCQPELGLCAVSRPGEEVYEVRECLARRGPSYKFCSLIKRERFHMEQSSSYTQPGHAVVLLPALLLVNLLPQELNYSICGVEGRIVAGDSRSISNVDLTKMVELSVRLENFHCSNALSVPPTVSSEFMGRLRLEDGEKRRLFLQVSVYPNQEAKLKIVITAPYWIVNRTGLPLVFRQEGVSVDTAGQFEEHEVARMVAPLLFSFADPDAGPTVVARVGSVIALGGSSLWCKHFHLRQGVQVRKLTVSQRSGRDVVYVVGIEVRQGRGRYRATHIVTVSPRYQLYNRSSYELEFAQACMAMTPTEAQWETELQKSYLSTIPNCHIPFHWPRLDKDQLLCVRLLDIAECRWSGGLRIEPGQSTHVNVRDVHGRMYLLRLEVVARGASHLVVFTDADSMPPPVRVDNYSEVTLRFAQASCVHVCTARAHSSVPYAWDEPTMARRLIVTAPGGVCCTYDLDKTGPGPELTYENFIYVAFSGTFKQGTGPLDVQGQQLVLDVADNGRVILAPKQPGKRSQLWRMSAHSQLTHEGSSPPGLPQHPRSDRALVLDIEGPAPQPSSYTRLALRRPDPRRRSTQTWRFTEDGRLCCAHKNMCVQAQDGFFGLRQGNVAVLGLPQQSAHSQFTETGVPIEQAVGKQRMRPGSGYLSVQVVTDGPTRVLYVRDIKDTFPTYAVTDDRDWARISASQRPVLRPWGSSSDPDSEPSDRLEFTVKVMLAGGLGVSLVTRRPAEELLYMQLTNIIFEMAVRRTNSTFCVSVQDVQCDNQLQDSSCPVALHVTRPKSSEEARKLQGLPSLDLRGELQRTDNKNTVIFQHLIVHLSPLTVYLEETLLLKLLAFVGPRGTDDEQHNVDESDFETQRVLTEVAGAGVDRCYFGLIDLVPSQVRLSVSTAGKLDRRLQAIKRRWGLTLIKFENAAVDLEPFVRHNSFETGQFLVNAIMKHFKEELLWQAAAILGSVDFLGNPLGFVNDVSEGVSGLIYDRSVGALVMNVTHGISDSAAKVTESLGDGLGRVVMDDAHDEMRHRIRRTHARGTTGDHLVAGIKGLGFGLLGGATGIFKQVYEGASSDGLQGVISGIGKGLVGAVAKPVVGVLDFASETARAVRDSSRGSSRLSPDRRRHPRCVTGPGGLLPPYDAQQCLGQMHLYAVNDGQYGERFVAYGCLRSGRDDLRIIVSDESVRIVTSANNVAALTTVTEIKVRDIISCRPVSQREGPDTRHYVEVAVRLASVVSAAAGLDPVKKPLVRCDSAELAARVSRQVNYARRLHHEGQFVLRTHQPNED